MPWSRICAPPRGRHIGKDGPNPSGPACWHPTSGKAQKAYFDLNTDQAANYEELKREILSRYGFNLARRAQLVHDWTFDPTLSPRAQISDLVWLATDGSTVPPDARQTCPG